MALCLRIIIEYPIIGNFFKENKYKNKKYDVIYKKRQKTIRLQANTILLNDKIKFGDSNLPLLHKKIKKYIISYMCDIFNILSYHIS